MKNIVLARVDDRLIHGEVVSVWTPSLNVNRIIVVDDEVAADKFNKRVIKALAPNGVKVNVYGTEKGADILQRDSKDPNERVMILTKTPITYDRMADMGLELSDVNLGGMGLRGERTPFIKSSISDLSANSKCLQSKIFWAYSAAVFKSPFIQYTRANIP